MSIHRNTERYNKRDTLMNIQIRKKILSYLGKEKVVTSSELARHLGVSWNTAQVYLLRLLAEKKVIEIKKQGVNLWMKK